TPLQHAAAVFGEQRIPVPAPHHFNNVPASTAELAFQLLNNFAVTAHRAIQALQVTVHHKDQVFQFFAAGQTDSPQGFRLITFTITEESPNFTAFTRH